MQPLHSNPGARFTLLLCAILAVAGSAAAQKRIPCPDGEHIEIDIRQIAIQYDASSFAGTLSSLSVLGGRLEVTPRKLQEAAVATQQWDEFLKGLVVGYNTCAVTRQQYTDGINRIYPRLQEDAASLEEIRKIISDGKKADEKRLQSLLDSYYANLRQFAQASGKEIILERIEALSAQVASGQTQIAQKEDVIIDQGAAILAKLNDFQQRSQHSPAATPAEISSEISDLRKSLEAKVDEAEAAYNKGYELLDQCRFQDAIAFFQQAAAAVQLPNFYLALGRTYESLLDLVQAQAELQIGLSLAKARSDEKQEAELTNELGLVLLEKGDLDAALTYAQRALQIDEAVYGVNHHKVARDASNIGGILREKGNLDTALSYAKRALQIDQKLYGLNDFTVAVDANNIGAILNAKGDLDGALGYLERALQINEEIYGPDHPMAAVQANNIGQILSAKGNLNGALSYAQRALQIDEKVYGPDHPRVAIDANNIGFILKAKGDLDGALSYTQRALQIDEKAYGPDHPKIAIRYNNIGQILNAKGDLDGALSYTQRALRINESIYGTDGAKVAIDANNIGTILKDKGDLDGAISYEQRALEIDQKVYGSDHPNVAVDANNIGAVLLAKGDLDGAIEYTQRALKILKDVYGPNNPATKMVAANLDKLEKLKQAAPK